MMSADVSLLPDFHYQFVAGGDSESSIEILGVTVDLRLPESDKLLIQLNTNRLRLGLNSDVR